MLQLTYTACDTLQWREAPEPALTSDGAALVRPRAVATCDLDALIIEGGSPFPPPFPIGHECVAEVVEVGDAVTSIAPGELVSVPFQISCGTCRACLEGRSAQLQRGRLHVHLRVRAGGGALGRIPLGPRMRSLRRAHARPRAPRPGAHLGGERI